VKRLIDWGGMDRLADFNADNVDRAIGKADDGVRSVRTVNVYRRCMHALAEWCVEVSDLLT